MLSRLFQKLHKKEAGASTYVSTLICLFVIVIMFLALFLNYSQIVRQNKVERTYRKYLLKMEKEGCLNGSDQASLITELTALGVNNIDLTGTSTAPVGYGQTVTLHIAGDLEVDKLLFTGSNPTRGKEDVHIEIEKTGTALY